MRRARTSRASERGAVLVHVALALLALTSFTAFIVDYGVLWTARRQAQNAADSAALAGAIGLAFDRSQQVARESAHAMLNNHAIWGQAPVVISNTDITFPTCPDDPTQDCVVKVDVYRHQSRGNALPAIFGTLVGLTQQNVRATATARVLASNSTDCLKPWFVADRWLESAPPYDESAIFQPSGVPPDSYMAPTPLAPGTGFNALTDHGRFIRLTVGMAGGGAPVNGGWFQASRIGNDNAYHAAIVECVPARWKIGDSLLPITPSVQVPDLAALQALTASGVNNLVNKDSGASWDPTANGGQGGVINSCVQWSTPCGNMHGPYRMSPRVVGVPVFDTSLFAANPANDPVIVGIMGFFVQGMDASGRITGYITTKPGVLLAGGSSVHGPTSFLKAVALIR